MTTTQLFQKFYDCIENTIANNKNFLFSIFATWFALIITILDFKEFQDCLISVSGILMLAALIRYTRALTNGDKQPSNTTWLIWAALDSIILAGMIMKGTQNAQIIAATIGVWILFLTSLRHGGIWGMKKRDLEFWVNISCIVGVVFSVSLGYAFGSPTTSIVIGLIFLFIGGFPTFLSAWKEPKNEDTPAWVIFWISAAFSTIAIPVLTIEDAGQPLTFLVIETLALGIILFRTFIKKPGRNLIWPEDE